MIWTGKNLSAQKKNLTLPLFHNSQRCAKISPRRLKYFLVIAFRRDVGFSACVQKIVPSPWISLHGLHYCVPHTITLFQIPLWPLKKTNDYWKCTFPLADVSLDWLHAKWSRFDLRELQEFFFLCHGFHSTSLVQYLFSRSRK